ncbi:hypothetical protein PSTT_14795 [Puccinia striiformis]|uniref:Uncharacterized protein n=1 Tax=Puccinia striiformis TaxID=27350 RepID=A0A2S4UKR8_9BASI|nr:hypothetical protein PSTT_14795 [Puccinia striiformis]
MRYLLQGIPKIIVIAIGVNHGMDFGDHPAAVLGHLIPTELVQPHEMPMVMGSPATLNVMGQPIACPHHVLGHPILCAWTSPEHPRLTPYAPIYFVDHHHVPTGAVTETTYNPTTSSYPGLAPSTPGTGYYPAPLVSPNGVAHQPVDQIKDSVRTSRRPSIANTQAPSGPKLSAHAEPFSPKKPHKETTEQSTGSSVYDHPAGEGLYAEVRQPKSASSHGTNIPKGGPKSHRLSIEGGTVPAQESTGSVLIRSQSSMAPSSTAERNEAQSSSLTASREIGATSNESRAASYIKALLKIGDVEKSQGMASDSKALKLQSSSRLKAPNSVDALRGKIREKKSPHLEAIESPQDPEKHLNRKQNQNQDTASARIVKSPSDNLRILQRHRESLQVPQDVITTPKDKEKLLVEEGPNEKTGIPKSDSSMNSPEKEMADFPKKEIEDSLKKEMKDSTKKGIEEQTAGVVTGQSDHLSDQVEIQIKSAVKGTGRGQRKPTWQKVKKQGIEVPPKNIIKEGVVEDLEAIQSVTQPASHEKEEKEKINLIDVQNTKIDQDPDKETESLETKNTVEGPNYEHVLDHSDLKETSGKGEENDFNEIVTMSTERDFLDTLEKLHEAKQNVKSNPKYKKTSNKSKKKNNKKKKKIKSMGTVESVDTEFFPWDEEMNHNDPIPEVPNLRKDKFVRKENGPSDMDKDTDNPNPQDMMWIKKAKRAQTIFMAKECLDSIFYENIYDQVFGTLHSDVGIDMQKWRKKFRSKNNLFTDKFPSQRVQEITKLWKKKPVASWHNLNLDLDFMHYISIHLKIDEKGDFVGLGKMQMGLFNMIIFFWSPDKDMNLKLISSIYEFLTTQLNEIEALRRMITLSKQFQQKLIQIFQNNIKASSSTPPGLIEDSKSGEYEKTFDFLGYYGINEERMVIKEMNPFHLSKFKNGVTNEESYISKFTYYTALMSEIGYRDRCSPRMYFPEEKLTDFINKSNYMNLIHSKDFTKALNSNGISLNRVLTVVLILGLEEEELNLDLAFEDIHYMAKILFKIMSPSLGNPLYWIDTPERNFLVVHHKDKFTSHFESLILALRYVTPNLAMKSSRLIFSESDVSEKPDHHDMLKQGLSLAQYYKRRDSILKLVDTRPDMQKLDEMLPSDLISNLQKLQNS